MVRSCSPTLEAAAAGIVTVTAAAGIVTAAAAAAAPDAVSVTGVVLDRGQSESSHRGMETAKQQ